MTYQRMRIMYKKDDVLIFSTSGSDKKYSVIQIYFGEGYGFYHVACGVVTTE